MQLIFNELSLNSNCNDIYKAERIFQLFIEAYHTAITNRMGFERGVITCVDLNTINIAPNYSASKWRNKAGIDRDLVRRFAGMCDKQYN